MPSIEGPIEMVKGMRNSKSSPLISLLTPPEVGSEGKKKSKPEIKFDENQEDLPITYHISHEAHFGPSPSSVSRSQPPSQNKPKATVLTSAPELVPIIKLQPQGSEPSAFQTDARDLIGYQNLFSARGDASYYFY